MTAFYQKFRAFALDWTWEEVVPAGGSEPAGDRDSPIFVGDGSKFVLAGGRTFAGSNYSDYWTFDMGTKLWTQVMASGGPISGSAQMGAVLDSGFLYQMGGGQTRKIDMLTGVSTNIGNPTALPSVATNLVFAGKSPGKQHHAGAAPATLNNYYIDQSVHQLTYSAFNSTLQAGGTGPNKVARTVGSYCPLDGKLHMLMDGAGTNLPLPDWTLSNLQVYTFDPAGPTGWTQVGGISNIAGPMNLGKVSACPMVWMPLLEQFFIFVSDGNAAGKCGFGVNRVLAWDPVRFLITEVMYSETPGDQVISGAYNRYGRIGEAGEVVVDASDNVYFIRHPRTGGPCRIQKFRRT